MKERSPSAAILLTALFLTLTANATFFVESSRVYPPGEHYAFLASLALVLLSATVFAMAMLALVLPLRLVLSAFLLMAAAASYFTDHFGVIISSEMLQNALQTDAAEVRDLVTLPFILRMVFLGILPAALVWKLALLQSTWQQRLVRSGGLGLASLCLSAIVIFGFSESYAGFFRQHKALRTYTNPLTPLYSAIRYAVERAEDTSPQQLAKTAADAHVAEEATEDRELVILVVGETARRDRFALNGYARDTNPELSRETRLVSYDNIVSCGTSTAISVPCIFSEAGHDDFTVEGARQQENILDILQRAGVSILWRDNNSSSKGVADRVNYQDFRHPDNNPVCDSECRDVGMLSGLQEYIDSQPGDILIVLHQMGNHGPAYFRRYPPEFEYFTPACQAKDLSECSREEIDNAYDNAIRYTDYFLSRVIQLLKHNTPAYETAMLYVSDHGESLGEHGLYLHGAPWFIAPQEQVAVPVILWLGESADIDLQDALALKDQRNSHDAIFYSLLAAFEIETRELEPGGTLFAGPRP
ncbi:phosphoethanolamine transferase [Haliea sp. E17]|uniref:phosphoethanolamine transferase n=1 Tax=Haliea sp. E17 TaxID=3401576 RepID=UPI003AB0B180